MQTVVLDGYALNPGDMSWGDLKRLTELTVHDRTAPESILERARHAQLLLTTKTPLASETIHGLRELRYIGVLATGYDNVDIGAARERGIVVTNIPAYGTASVAQFVFALLLELCNKVKLHSEAVREGEWSRNPDWSFWKAPLIELSGKIMGIVGFGRIGRQVARIADALEMRVIAADALHTNAPDYPGFRWAPVNELLEQSDVVSLHCPLVPETHGLMNAERLRLMKSGAMLINTSRGALVVDRDLADALNSGQIAGAGLDVLPVEPPPPGNPLCTAKNCLVTPHIAWATLEARSRLMRTAVGNVAAFLQGRPENVVS